ncbi:alpha/beta fold hydrolase [Alteromonas facilis]|uniref:alpha/beta fold hydrolase n=1 Tax=Alteromonas facilis TaxID=2048004 RepID=UPI001F0BB414|nr:alpha/beta fold hydrolase [Alteromonas facilis]
MLAPDISQYRQSARYAQLKGHSIAFWQHTNPSSAGTVLFIHGFPSAAWDWHHQWAALAHDYSLVALDLLGFGLSDKPHPIDIHYPSKPIW